MTETSLARWLAWIGTLSPAEIDLALDRVRAVLDRLDLAKPARVVHVAGTNGKGSCAAMLESLLLEAGFDVGCYTSPHVLRYNERIRVNGQEVGDEEIVAAFDAVEAARKGLALTWFEYGTLAALVIFDRRHVDSLVLEIGMGGRLDAVNAVEPDGGIITNIALDHCDWLGADVEAIGFEKAGIMRVGKPCVFGAAEPPATLVAEAARLGADLRLAGRDYTWAPAQAGAWRWRGRARSLERLAAPALPGIVQHRNAAAVLALIEAMGLDEHLSPATVNAALGRLRLPGRMQRIGRWLMDVAHNPAAAGVLAEALQSAGRRGAIAIVGVLADKDVDGILRPLLPVVDRWIAVTADSPRALDAHELAGRIATLANSPCYVATSMADAMREAAEAEVAGDILVTGSFYTVGPALAWLEANDGASRS